MRNAAATVADRFHTDAEPDTLVSLAIPGKEEFLLSSPCQSVRLSGFVSLLSGTTETTATMPVHAISHYDLSASYRIADWRTVYDNSAGATPHSSVTDALLGKEKIQTLCLIV
jgi:hypothetical protein